MTLFERAYITTREKELWDEYQEAKTYLGSNDAYTKLVRARWNEIYRLCNLLFKDYSGNETSAE